MKEKILVTGGLGYIGSHTVIHLIQLGYEVIIVDNLCRTNNTVLDKIEIITGKRPKLYPYDCFSDRRELNAVFSDNPDIFAVMHFAGYKNSNESMEHPIMYYKNNCGALIQIMDLMAIHGVKYLIFSSSYAVYGDNIDSKYPVVNEDTPVSFGLSPFANTKIVSEQLIKDICKARNLYAVILRYFNPIGAHKSCLIGENNISSVNNILPTIIRAAKCSDFEMNIFGSDYDSPDGTNIRDYIDVNDIATANGKALLYIPNAKKRIETFNIGSGKGTSILELIRTFEEVNNVKVKYSFTEKRACDIPIAISDCEKSSKLLNFTPEIPIEESLKNIWLSESNI